MKLVAAVPPLPNESNKKKAGHYQMTGFFI